MKIHATFANFTYDPEEITLVHAWDEYAVDNNPEGYATSLAEELATYGDDLLMTRTLLISVPYAPLENAFRPLNVTGEIAAMPAEARS